MARTALTVGQMVPGGLDMSPTAANVDGHSFVNDGNTFLYIKNADVSPVTITIQTPAQVGGLDIAEVSDALAASGEALYGPFPTHIFNQADGTVNVDFSGVTSLTILAVKL